MEIILKTQKGNYLLETGFDEETNKFITRYTCNEKVSILERFNKIDELIPTHDFWCKITGLIPNPVSIKDIEPYISNLKLAK